MSGGILHNSRLHMSSIPDMIIEMYKVRALSTARKYYPVDNERELMLYVFLTYILYSALLFSVSTWMTLKWPRAVQYVWRLVWCFFVTWIVGVCVLLFKN